VNPPLYPMSFACYGMSAAFGAKRTLPRPSLARRAALGPMGYLKMTLTKLALASLLSLSGYAASAAATPMAQDKHINDELRAGFAGDILRKTCPTISARMFVVVGRLYDLKSYAESHGYTAADYDAFRSDPAEKARLKAEAAAYLAKAGAKPGDVESYCQVGRDEIAKGTPLGTLIRSSK
jgi:hypothetical protein